MSRLTLFRVGFLFLILFFTTTAKAQKEAETFNVDSTLYEYYQRCQEYLLEPVVLNMSDTLFRMAGERQDERMQAVAIATQLDYYYFQGTNEDSVIHYTNKVKEFAKATHQPKYYYFAWANRLITYYLKTSRTNIALYEVQNMLKEAQEEDDKTGLSRCYNIMSQIYTIKRFDSMAFEWRLKEIELTEKYKIENYNISQTYAQIANYYINQKKQKEALAAVEKAIATANSSTQQISAKLEFVNYYSKFGDFQAAEKLLKECQAAFEQDKRLESIKKRLYNIECLYYQQTKQYQKALEAAKMQEKEERRLSESILSSSHYRTQGEIYQKMGNMNLAVKYLQMYINTDDSLKIANEQVASSEFATLLNVEKLNAEKKELMLQAQEKELHNKTTLIISLIILLGILFIFLYRENFLKRKLKVSEAELKTRNEELMVSREELRKARLHEFSKVELVRIDKPEHSKQSHQEMLDHVEGLLQKLELPYRILRLCGGDMSFTAALCFDFEVYSEAQKRWLEVSSVSNFDTYQANRLKCRYRNAEKKTELCHTLNGSALALPRIVAALLENNQTPEGIRIPKALVPYCGFDMID